MISRVSLTQLFIRENSYYLTKTESAPTDFPSGALNPVLTKYHTIAFDTVEAMVNTGSGYTASVCAGVYSIFMIGSYSC